jgi:hypothetical protein
MKDDDPERTALREMIADAMEECKDTSVLDLIYKLLKYENKEVER